MNITFNRFYSITDKMQYAYKDSILSFLSVQQKKVMLVAITIFIFLTAYCYKMITNKLKIKKQLEDDCNNNILQTNNIIPLTQVQRQLN